MKKLRVTIDGKAYEVVVEEIESVESGSAAGPSAPRLAPAQVAASVTPPPAAAAPPPTAGDAAGAPGAPGAIGSPLAGRVVSVDCAVGQAIAAGAKLVTLEAMKMNTYVYADRAGTVSAIHVQAGDGVEEGQALVTVS